MPPRDQSRFWKKCRIGFRRFRIAVWAVLLALLCCVLYLNRVGLPEFVKRPLLQKLHARGIDLEFTRMRWRLDHGIVAENVRFMRTEGAVTPAFSVQEAELRLDYRALARLQLQVKALILREGEIAWEVAETNAPAQKLSLDAIQTELHLLPGDRWELRNFQAEFAGAKLQLGGILTNASAIREWKANIQKDKPSSPERMEQRMRQLAQTLQQIHFSTPPELNLDVRGDARDLQSFTVRLNLDTPDARTPWGELQNAFLVLTLLPGSSNVLSHAELKLDAARAHTPWASATNLNLHLDLLAMESETNVVHADLHFTANQIQTRWANASAAQFSAQWLHNITNAIPVSGGFELQLAQAHSEWADAGELRFSSSFARRADLPQMDESWLWWTNLAPYSVNWECDVSDLDSPKIQVNRFSGTGAWLAPNLTLNRIFGELYQGELNAQAGLDIATRRFKFSGSSDFDVQRISPLLTEKSREWISQFGWMKPPQLRASGSIPLPAWTNLLHADWRGDVRPGIRLDGHFAVGKGSFREVQFDAAESGFSYSNLFWRLPDLVARRPEGEIRLSHISNEATRDYHFKIHSSIHPLALKPLLETNQYRIYDVLGFNQPPVLDAEIWGRWYDHDRIGARTWLAATNFTVHGESFDHAVGRLEYTNLFITITEPQASRNGGAEYGSADGLGIDIPARKIYLTNAVGVADPGVVTRAVGPHVGELMEPYKFHRAISARAHGVIPMRDPSDADLHFEINGGPFEWWKFKLAHVTGRVDWIGEGLELNGIHAGFYDGTASGDAVFDFRNEAGARFRFDVLANNADLQQLMNAVAGRTNRLEGRLSGRLTITDGFSTNLHTLNGSGRLELKDGLIWDIPLFGILSPVLDGIAPGMGLGSSRAREGTASFNIRRGILNTDDLEIRASMMRLQYSGSVDLATTGLNAKAQAELLRDTWVVGRLLSLTLWPVSKVFEYRFTGTLDQPKSEPVFLVPKILLLPFHPIRTIKELAPEFPSSNTNRVSP